MKNLTFYKTSYFYSWEKEIFNYQINCYNKIYRDIDGREILFYYYKFWILVKNSNYKKLFNISNKPKKLCNFTIKIKNKENITGNLCIVMGRIFSLNFNKSFDFSSISDYEVIINQFYNP